MWYKLCLNDFCAATKSGDDSGAVVCTTFAAYSQMCADHMLVVEWRTATLCRKSVYRYHFVLQ